MPIVPPDDPCGEPSALAFERSLDPIDVHMGGTNKPEPLHLKRYDLDIQYGCRRPFDRNEVHEREVAAVALVSRNPLIIVQKITAAVENQAVAI